MPPVDVIVTTWPNHPQRLAYLAKCLASLWALLVGDYRIWVSSETEQDPKQPWLGQRADELAGMFGAALFYRREDNGDGKPADLGGAMNDALNIGCADHILFVQDDFELFAPLDLAAGVACLQRRPEVDLLRYMCSGTEFHPGQAVDGFRVVNLQGKWPYGDNPHLRRRTFPDKWGHYLTGVPHGHSESEMRDRLVRGNALILASQENIFRHVGHVTSVPNDTRKRSVSR